MTSDQEVSALSIVALRDHAPTVLGALTRRLGDFDAAEDAVQEALLAASTRWVVDGIPDNPAGWLYTAARNRLVDTIRAEASRRTREQTYHDATAPLDDPAPTTNRDDTLNLFFLCCHPSLGDSAQIALTLRRVAGLSTAQIAAAYLVPEPTIGQRISRAKQRLLDADARFRMPMPVDLPSRLDAVLRVLYLLFTAGHTASTGPELVSVDLTTEAIRLTRQLRNLVPDHGETIGLLALMLLTDARRPARVGTDGSLVPLDEQDRSVWDPSLIDEGLALVSDALTSAPIGAFPVQAAIAAVHAEATSTDETDWVQILGLYALLDQIAPSPVVTLNSAVVLARVTGPDNALRLLDTVADDPHLSRHHRLPAVRAHLLQMAGDTDNARIDYLTAARRTTSVAERRYLERRAAALSPTTPTTEQEPHRP